MFFFRVENNTRGIEIIADIDAACFDPPWRIQQWRAEIENPENHIFLISKDRELLSPTGFFSFGISGDCAELRKIAVLPAYRRQHIADMAMSKLREEARLLKLDNILVEVAITNLAAIRLYEKHIFYKISIRKKYYNNLVDALVLQKEI